MSANSRRSIATDSLNLALIEATTILKQFAPAPDFLAWLREAFGEDFDPYLAGGLAQQWQSGDFSLIPEIQVVTGGELGTANGAYAADLDTIFVSAEFLARHQDDRAAVVGLLLEEIGHKLDRVLNGNVDSPGDEGAIFRLVVTGQRLSPELLVGLRTQHHRSVISIDGVAVAVERQDFFGDAGGVVRNDTIIGTAGDDNIFGFGGNDTLDGGGGNDTINGGSGDDNIILSGDAGADTIDGGVGNDLLRISGQFNDTADKTLIYTDAVAGGTIVGGPLNGTTFKNIEFLRLGFNLGNNYIDVSAATGNFTTITNPDGFVGSIFNEIGGGQGNDTIIGSSGNGDSLDGGGGNDTITGGAGNNTLRGGTGNDTLTGREGNDGLFGGAGNDTLNGANPNSVNPGRGERDTLTGEGGTLTIEGGADTFILSDRNNIYYDDGNTATDGANDYALITDFNPLEDKAQLQGSASNYLLRVIGTNTNLYIDKPNTEPDELIATFQRITGLSLTSAAFTYVDPIEGIPTISVTASDSTAGETTTTEPANPGQFTLTRTGNLTQSLVVNYTLTGTATSVSDYQSLPGTVTFAANASTATIDLNIVDDNIFEPTESVTLNLTANAAYTLATANSATVNIIDNDRAAGVLSFGAANYSVNENGTPVQAITIVRTGGSDGSVGATVSLANGTAVAPGDYNATSIGVSFANGETSKTITVPIVDDTLIEGTETINLTLGSVTGGATLGTQTAVLSIIDNEAKPTISIGNVSINEGNSGTTNATFAVTLNTASTQTITVDYATANGTATAGSDYNSVNLTTLTFAPGELSKNITVGIIGDTTVEPNETFKVDLSNPTNATLGTANSGTGTILNEDVLVLVIGTPQSDLLNGGDSDDNISGDAGNDTINAGAGNDIIFGGIGTDNLFGGAGRDTFAYNSPTEGFDKINDFVVSDDLFTFSRTGFGGDTVFGGDPVGMLGATRFGIGTAATTASQRFIYNDRSGVLSFDADGVGGTAQVRIAQLVGIPALTSNNFTLI